MSVDASGQASDYREWLARLVELRPSDSRLTDTVLTAAGGLPIHVEPVSRTMGLSAADIVDYERLNRIGAIAQFKGATQSNLTVTINQKIVAAYECEDPTEAADLQAQVSYLEQIREYVSRLR